MSDKKCTIRGEALGQPVPACGGDASVVLTGQCQRGHTRTRPVCQEHAAIFTAMPNTVVCEPCDAEGYESVLPLTAAPTTGEEHR